MSKQNSAECQFAINMFKATEMSMKKLLDLLEKTVEQKKSFRSLSLMINKIKGQETELKKLSEEVMRQQPHQSTASSILNRQTTLITRLNELELQVDLLDDDGQLSQSSSRIRNDVSMISSRRNLSRQSTPAPSDDKERIQHQRDIEGKQTSSDIFNQPPPLPPRPRQPSLFLQTSNEPGLQIQHVLEAHQRNPKKEVHESLLKSKTKLGNELNVPNPFPCFDKDISQKFTSPTRSGKLEIASNLVNRDVCDIETAQINLSDNFDTSQNLLPPIQNLNLSGNHSLSNPFILADPTIQLQADGLFAQNSALEKTLNLKLPKRRNNQDSYANRNPQYHNFPNLQQNVGPSEVKIGTNGYLDSQVLNCDLQKLPCLPTVANRTSHLPSTTDKIVAENNCLQSNQYINPITGVHSASVPPITVQLMEQQHQNTVLNPAAPNFLPNQVAPQSNGIAAPLQFPQPVNSQHGLTSTFPVNQNVTQPSQLCNNQFVPDSQVPSNCQAPLTSTIHAPMCINQHSNPAGQNQLSQPLINQSLLPTVNQHISSAYSNPNVTQEKGNVDFKHSIKLPPLKLQNFNGDPIHFHEWINNFNTMIHNNPSITDTHRITYLQNSVSGKAKDLIHAYSCDPSYYQTALNELIRHFGDRTIVVNAFINQLENWQMNFQNKQSFIAFSSFLKRLVQAFQYLGFTADLQSTALIKKAKEKTPHHLVLKWTEHCLTELNSDPTLVDFQQWLGLQAQIYDKVSRESNQRTISSQASKFVNSNNPQTKQYNGNPSVSVNNASAENSRKQWNFGPQQKQPSISQNVPNKTFNTKRSCEKCKQEHSIATCPEYQLCSPSDRYNLVSQNNLCTNCLSNKHHKQSCPSQKRCQVCSGFHHTTLHDPAKQIKRPTAAFSTEVFSGNNPTASSSSKASSQTPNTSSQQKSQTNKAPNSRSGQTFNNQSQQNVQRRNLNGNAINQSFSINQCSETPKNWYEQLQLIPVSFLKGKKPSIPTPS